MSGEIPTPTTATPLITSTHSILLRITVAVPMIGLGHTNGYLGCNRRYGTVTLEPTELNMWEIGSYEQKNTGPGSIAFAVENPVIQPCFATEIRGSAKPTSRKKYILCESKVLLRSYDARSLVIDALGDWARGKNAAVACFYFDFAAQREQSPTRVLSSLLKQVVQGLEQIPTKITEAFQGEGGVIGGRILGLGEIVEILQDISRSRPTFICIDGLDECLAEYRVRLLDSLKNILHGSPSTRIFLAGRPHVRDEVERHLAGRMVAVSIMPTRDDIIRFLRAKLREDATPEAMDNSLEEDIVRNIPETVSEM